MAVTILKQVPSLAAPRARPAPLRPARAPAAPPPAADAPRSLGPQVMEEKLDITNVEVAAVKMPPAKEAQPVTAACHYVPGGQHHPQYSVYTKEQLETIIGRLAAPAS